MSRIGKAIRNKRFDVKEDVDLQLLFENHDFRLTGQVKNAAVMGMMVEIGCTDQPDAMLVKEGDLITASRLTWGEAEQTLGRLLVRRVNQPDATETSGVVQIGLHCLDQKVPLMESLSHCFEDLANGEESPFGFELGSGKFSLANFTEEEFKHPDLFEKCRQYEFLHQDLRRQPLYQYYAVKYENNGGRATYRLPNRPKKKDYVSFASYDYMGYSRHPAVVEAAKAAIDKFGLSSGGSMILAGKTDLHEKLEKQIATFLGKEDSILFPTGFAANVGAITSLARQNDLIIADISCHASLHDGIQSTASKVKYFRHNDMDHLEKILKAERPNYNACLLITEGIYSMEGSIPNLKRFVKLADQYNARTYIDECHSLGCLGNNGRGAADQAGVLEDIDLFMGSFSKGLGVGGCGFIAGSKTVVDWFRFFSRSAMFSGAVSTSIVAASLAVLDLLETDVQNIERLRKNIGRFHDGLKSLNIETPAADHSPIIPILVDDNAKISKMNNVLLDLGIYVNCIMFPAVPIHAPRFRFSITAKHNESDIDLALAALEMAIRKVGSLQEEKNDGPSSKPQLIAANIKRA